MDYSDDENQEYKAEANSMHEDSDIFDTDSSADDDIRLTEYIDEDVKQRIANIKDQGQKEPED